MQPHWLQSARLLCSWDFSSKNTGVGSHSLLQGMLRTQGLNLGPLHCRRILLPSEPPGKPCKSCQFSPSVMSDSLRPHGQQHTRPPCPSPIPRVYSNLCQLGRWCHPTISSSVVPLLLPSIFPSIRVFSNESALHIRRPKYWSFSFNISPSNEHPGLISFRINWLDLLAVQGTLKSLLQHHSSDIGSDIMLKNSGKWLIYLLMLY